MGTTPAILALRKQKDHCKFKASQCFGLGSSYTYRLVLLVSRRLPFSEVMLVWSPSFLPHCLCSEQAFSLQSSPIAKKVRAHSCF